MIKHIFGLLGFMVVWFFGCHIMENYLIEISAPWMMAFGYGVGTVGILIKDLIVGEVGFKPLPCVFGQHQGVCFDGHYQCVKCGYRSKYTKLDQGV